MRSQPGAQTRSYKHPIIRFFRGRALPDWLRLVINGQLGGSEGRIGRQQLKNSGLL
ncbi:hypothetical protein ADG881_1140 [Alcanivorax sp. DG881]|nr:hypothetical protein ADG881_1140 [Alcanivorax sp. DG881]